MKLWLDEMIPGHVARTLRVEGFDVLGYLDGRAPAVCVHTGVKRLLRLMGHLVDDNGHVAIVALVVFTVLPWALVVAAFLGRS